MLTIDEEIILRLYSTMIRIRAFENQVRVLIQDGEIPARFGLYTGQEAVATGVCIHLNPNDQIGSTHRALGHLIAKGCNIKHLMAELCGKSTGFNKGKAGPYHIFDPSVGALGANGIVGGSVPMVAGYALAHQINNDGGVSVSFFGEGASNQGGVQETLNLAACWDLPIIFVCENSSFDVQSMLGHEIDFPQLSIEKVSDRAKAYGMPGSTHDGLDVLNIYHVVKKAITRAREGNGPTLLEFNVHQIEGNLEGRIEAKPDEKIWCPIDRLQKKLLDNSVLTNEQDKSIRNKERSDIDEATKYALRGPYPKLIEAFTDVFSGDEIK
jgi:pyruvate dehydrogenase E1 component alpha subunit